MSKPMEDGSNVLWRWKTTKEERDADPGMDTGFEYAIVSTNCDNKPFIAVYGLWNGEWDVPWTQRPVVKKLLDERDAARKELEAEREKCKEWIKRSIVLKGFKELAENELEAEREKEVAVKEYIDNIGFLLVDAVGRIQSLGNDIDTEREKTETAVSDWSEEVLKIEGLNSLLDDAKAEVAAQRKAMKHHCGNICVYDGDSECDGCKIKSQGEEGGR